MSFTPLIEVFTGAVARQAGAVVELHGSEVPVPRSQINNEPAKA